MKLARPLRLIAMIAALFAVVLGLGTYTHADFTNAHMLFGLLVAISLLILALLAAFTDGLRRLGIIGIVYAIILPLFGVTQQMILPGEWHWLIEAAHLLVGFGAIALSATLSARLVQSKQQASRSAREAQLVG